MSERTLGRRAARKALLAAAAAAAAAATVRQSLAANKGYNGPSGNWSTITWVPAGQPVNGDTVTIGNGTNGIVIVTYDAGAIANSLSQITLDATNAGLVTLSQAQGVLTITGSEYAGLSGAGALNLSGGAHTVTAGLYFGFNGGASGSGTLSGSGVLNVGNEEYVGYSGNGTFLQSGGSNTTFYLTTGYNGFGNGFGTNVGSGVYTQTGGNLTVTGGEYVGWYGNGIVNQSGGVNTAANLYIGNNTNGTNAAASGVYSMSNGASLTVNGAFLVGYAGNGTFNQTGGNATASSGIILAAAVGGTGVVNLSGGTLTSPTVAINNASSFHQTGGTLNLTGAGSALLIGNSTATATYTLDGANSALSIAGSAIVGNGGNGSFTQNAGTTTISAGGSNGLFVGLNTGNSGTVTLGVGTFAVTSSEYVGESGIGVFNQSGGSSTAFTLYVGALPGSSGSYSMSNGATLSVTANEYIGNQGNGTFNQAGGSNSAASMYLGEGGISAYSLSNAASLRVNNELQLGVFSTATFNQTGGAVSVNGAGSNGLYLGYNPGAGGTYTLGGGGTLTVAGTEYVGFNGNGNFNQTGGTNSTSLLLSIGDQPGGRGTYTLSAGMLLAPNNAFVGSKGQGTFTQSGGTATLGELDVGIQAGAIGLYNLLPNGSLSVSFIEHIGVNGTGTFNQSGGSHTVSLLSIGSGSGSLGTFNLSGGSLSMPGNGLLIGENFASNSVMNQSGGTATCTVSIVGVSGPSGTNPAAVGTYNLSNGATLTIANSETVGYSGIGTFNQTGGSHAANALTLGANASGTSSISFGAFNLSDGNLNVTNTETVGDAGYGVFTQSGGTNLAATLTLGNVANPAAGTYTLSGGVLGISGNEIVGNSGRGLINHAGGSNSAVSIYLGLNPGASGAYNLSNGGTVTVSALLEVGFSGVGVYSQTGGVANINGTGTLGLAIGQTVGSSGFVNLLGGSLNAPNQELVGINGSGFFNQTGGSNFTNSLNLAAAVSGTNLSTGLYNLSGGLLSASNGVEYIGFLGSGTFNQSGGTNLSGATLIGYGAKTTGAYSLSNGATLSAGNEHIGYFGNGSFGQTGGSNASSNNLYLASNANGTNPASTGTYTLSGGSLSVGFTEYVGNGGIGVFNQSGGTNTGFYLNLGQNSNAGGAPLSFGTYNLSNGATLQMNGGSIGVGGNGVFNQTGGTFNFGTNGANELNLGLNASGAGTVNLSGGAMIGGNFFLDFVGYLGRGVFNQSGGSNSIYYLRIGSGSAATGIYNLSGGSLAVGFDEFVGQNGSGTFVQSGGTHTTQYLNIGNATLATSTGLYSMTGGTLSVSAEEYEGLHGFGTFNHSGGTNSVGNLFLGYYSNSAGVSPASGIYNMSNGATLAVSTNENVGLAGNGLFNQTGGLHSIGSWLYVGNYASGVGTYNLSGGTLSATLETVGNSGAGTFNQTGGSNSVGWGGLSIAANPGSTGNYNLAGGTLSGNVNNNGTFTQTGGTYNGTFTNNLNFTYGGGQFNGMFVQQAGAVFTFAPPASEFVAYGGMTNYGTLTIGPGQTIAAVPMDIEGGAVILNGGNITGGDLLNNGSISGYGTIVAAGFTNNAVITQGAGNLSLWASSNALNNGLINLALSRQFQIAYGTSLANAGTINVNGAQVTGTNALINLPSGILSGPGMIATPLSNAGTVLVPLGTFNVVQPFTNTGLIQLTGPGASLIGGAITNTGTIQGVGSVGSPISNLGTIEALGGGGGGGGTLNLAGAVTNAASGLFRVSTGNKLLVSAGLATNFGAIDLVGGTFDNNNHALTNNGSIAGFGILSTSGLTNASGRTITFNGGFTTVNGDVTNSAGATIRAALNPVLFAGSLVNNGVVKVTGAPTNTVTIAGTYSGAGTYNSDPADNYFLSDVSVSPGGQVLGSVGDRFFISGTYSNAGAYDNSGGTLAAQNVVNQGSLAQSAGQATMLALSGTGATTVGGGGTALASVASMSQGSVTINTGGTLLVRHAATRATNTVGTLTISGNGLLDLSNHALLLDNAATPETSVRQYLRNAYNADASGIGNWNGRGGITSADAIAAHNGPNADFRISIGYVNGAYANDPLISGPIPGQETLATSRIIVRPALYGDLNLDGKVDDLDLQIFSGLGQYNQPADKFGWLGGDLNHDGKVDDVDLQIFSGAGNYNGPTYGSVGGAAHSSATPSAPTLTGHVDPATGDIVLSAATSIGAHGDGVLDFDYDPTTGHLKVNYDGDTRVTAANPLQVIRFKSGGGHFIPAAFNGSGFSNTTTDNSTLNGTILGGGSLPDGYDFGAVLASGLQTSDLISDLTLQWNVSGGGLSLKNGDVVVPEPGTLGLIGLGGIALRRRRVRPVGVKHKLSPFS